MQVPAGHQLLITQIRRQPNVSQSRTTHHLGAHWDHHRHGLQSAPVLRRCSMWHHGRHRRVRTVIIRSSKGIVQQWQANLFCTIELVEKDDKVVKVLCRDFLWTTEYILGNNDSVEVVY